MAKKEQDNGNGNGDTAATLIEFSSRGKKKNDSVFAVVPLTHVHVNKDWNPRGKDLGDLSELKASIKNSGLDNPLTVRPRKGQEGHFDLICGERRLSVCKELDFHAVPVKVRVDLAEKDKDGEAFALAVAENSEDARTALNAIALGKAFSRMAEEYAMTVPQIASETGHNAQKVRRYIQLMEASPNVLKKVETEGLAIMAALEYTKIEDEDIQKKVAKELTAQTSAADVKRLQKKYAQEDGAVSESPGKRANQQTGKSRSAALAVWRSKAEKHSAIAELCHLYLEGADDKSVYGTADFHEIRGAIGALFWDANELDLPQLPELDSDDPTDVKIKKKLESLIKAHAKKFVPREEEAVEEAAAA